MPTYEYKCDLCGSIFEQFQRITEEPLTRCIINNCEGPVHRMISQGAGILFKGSGFYETDYRSESYKKAATSEKESGSSSTTPSKKDSTATSPSTPASTASTPASSKAAASSPTK